MKQFAMQVRGAHDRISKLWRAARVARSWERRGRQFQTSVGLNEWAWKAGGRE